MLLGLLGLISPFSYRASYRPLVLFFYKTYLSCRLEAASVGRGSVSFCDCVASERLLLETYGVSLPGRPERVPPGPVDKVSLRILERFEPALLDNFSPLSVNADGNCLYRGISRSLYGTEDHHLMIRLLTTLEIGSHSTFYDIYDSDYVDIIRDDRVLVDRYFSYRC